MIGVSLFVMPLVSSSSKTCTFRTTEYSELLAGDFGSKLGWRVNSSNDWLFDDPLQWCTPLYWLSLELLLAVPLPDKI